jgi:hypothetical protein
MIRNHQPTNGGFMNTVHDATINLGDYLVPDSWPDRCETYAGLGGILAVGDIYCDARYIGSQFKVRGWHESYPVNLEISGRSLNYTKFSKPAIRVKIEWVRDGEPNTTSHGWIVLNS